MDTSRQVRVNMNTAFQVQAPKEITDDAVESLIINEIKRRVEKPIASDTIEGAQSDCTIWGDCGFVQVGKLNFSVVHDVQAEASAAGVIISNEGPERAYVKAQVCREGVALTVRDSTTQIDRVEAMIRFEKWPVNARIKKSRWEGRCSNTYPWCNNKGPLTGYSYEKKTQQSCHAFISVHVVVFILSNKFFCVWPTLWKQWRSI